MKNNIYVCNGRDQYIPVRKSKSYKVYHGLESYFVRIKQDSGIKFFHNDTLNCEGSFTLQKKLHRIGIAPMVLSEIKRYALVDKKGILLLGDGYVTEYASRPNSSQFKNMINDLMRKFDKLRLPTHDLSMRNTGIIKGKLVAVDFGLHSIT